MSKSRWLDQTPWPIEQSIRFVALTPTPPEFEQLAELLLWTTLAGACIPLGAGLARVERIRPQSRLERHWAPPLGAVLGFVLALAGNLWL